MLDAPVSGGEPKAIDGAVGDGGGDKAIFRQYYDLMKAMAGSVVRRRYRRRQTSQNWLTGNRGVEYRRHVATLTLATKAGVSPDLVYPGDLRRLAGSTVLDAKAPMVMDRKL